MVLRRSAHMAKPPTKKSNGANLKQYLRKTLTGSYHPNPGKLLTKQQEDHQ
jgi:hypothetical protein